MVKIGKVENVKEMEQSRLNVNGNTERQADDYETVLVIKSINVFDPKTGKYTDEVNQKSLRVETWVDDIRNEKPVVVGYINVATLEGFLDGMKKAVPIRRKKESK